MKNFALGGLGVLVAMSLAACGQTETAPAQPATNLGNEVKATAALPSKDQPNGWTEVAPGVWEKTEGTGVNATKSTFIERRPESLEWVLNQHVQAAPEGLAAQSYSNEELEHIQANIDQYKVWLDQAKSLSPQAATDCSGNAVATVKFNTDKTANMAGYANSSCPGVYNPGNIFTKSAYAKVVATAKGRAYRDEGRATSAPQGYHARIASVTPTFYTLAEWPDPSVDCIRSTANATGGYLVRTWGRATTSPNACQ